MTAKLKAKMQEKFEQGKYLICPTLGWLGFFFIIPLMIVVVVSFASRTPYGEVVFDWTLESYARFLEPLYLKIFFNTILVSLFTTVLTILMGYPLAYYIVHLPKKWRQVGLIMVMVPFWINFLIRSYAWVIVLRSQGLVNTILLNLGIIDRPLQLLYNGAAVMVGMVYALLPFMVLPVYVTLEQMDWRLLEAAYDLGASPFTAFKKITLPLSIMGVAEGTIMVFISSLGMFIVPDVMGGAKTVLIGNLIQNQFLSARDWPFGSALSIILAVLSLVLIMLYYKALSAHRGGAQNA